VLAIAAHEAKENGSASNSPKNGSASANGGARPAADARVKTQVPATE
jgi:hypothetical protein